MRCSRFILKTILIMSLCPFFTNSFAKDLVNGAGSSFIAPVLTTWASQYQGPVNINYQAIGSAAGISQLTQHSLDFAASDKPLTIQELNTHHWQQFPAVMSGIVPIVNIQGIANNQLRLNGSLLANIYQGDIKYWDNAEIKQLNPKLTLPHALITTIHRADGSGTSYNFTYYLSQVSKTWQQHVGFSTNPQWPGDNALGAKGNAGVASQVQNTANAIGYVEYAYAAQTQLPMVTMVNADGATVSASLNSFNSASRHASWHKQSGYSELLANEPGKDSWPIMATTYVLIPKHNTYHSQIIQFFKTSMLQHHTEATALSYVLVPHDVINNL